MKFVVEEYILLPSVRWYSSTVFTIIQTVTSFPISLILEDIKFIVYKSDWM